MFPICVAMLPISAQLEMSITKCRRQIGGVAMYSLPRGRLIMFEGNDVTPSFEWFAKRLTPTGLTVAAAERAGERFSFSSTTFLGQFGCKCAFGAKIVFANYYVNLRCNLLSKFTKLFFSGTVRRMSPIVPNLCRAVANFRSARNVDNKM